MDENNSDISKQNKKIDKLDNDNKIIAQEKIISSGLNLPFTKGITGTALGLGWYKGLRKNRVALEN